MVTRRELKTDTERKKGRLWMLFLDNLSVTTLKISYMYFFFADSKDWDKHHCLHSAAQYTFGICRSAVSSAQRLPYMCVLAQRQQTMCYFKDGVIQSMSKRTATHIPSRAQMTQAGGHSYSLYSLGRDNLFFQALYFWKEKFLFIWIVKKIFSSVQNLFEEAHIHKLVQWTCHKLLHPTYQ